MKNLTSALALSAALLLVAGCSNEQQKAPAANDAAPATADVTSAAPANASQGAPAPRLVNWGPQSTPAGTPFQVQADGGSGMFFEFDQTLPAAPTAVTFDGKPLGGMVAEGKMVTATIPADFLSQPGSYEIAIVMPEGAPVIPPVSFTVDAPAP